jgi:fucose permease
MKQRIITGALLILLPFRSDLFSLGGLVIFGLGCAPVYPSIIHSTPANFGANDSQAIIGIQMASAYTGTTLMPPLFGLIAHHVTVAAYPFFLALFAVLLLVMTEKVNRLTATP